MLRPVVQESLIFLVITAYLWQQSGRLALSVDDEAVLTDHKEVSPVWCGACHVFV